MALYRKKPVTVEAVQYDGTGDHSCFPEGMCREAWDPEKPCLVGGMWQAHIHTLEGVMLVQKGDWIVGPGAEGEYWPVKNSIFHKTYDRVVLKDNGGPVCGRPNPCHLPGHVCTACSPTADGEEFFL